MTGIRVAVVALALLFGIAASHACSTGAPGGIVRPPEESLLLELKWVAHIPADRPVSDLAPAAEDAVIAWYRDDGWLGIVGPNGTVFEAGIGTLQRPVGAALNSRGDLEVIERSGHLVTIDLARPHEWSRAPLHLPFDSVQTAVRANDRWRVGGWRAVDSSWVAVAIHGDTAESLIQLKATSATPVDVRMTALNADVTLTTIRAPFMVLHLSEDGEERRLSAVVSALGDSLQGPSWYSMGALRVPPGWVQVLANRRADDRILVTYAQTGEVLRWSRVPVALGLVAHGHDPFTVLGMRDVGAGEKDIVVYEWRWEREQPN